MKRTNDVTVIETEKNDSPFGEVISSYSRAQAIEDGFLVDVSKLAQEAGFKYPVAITVEAFAAVEVPEGMEKFGQDLTGRLWDVFTMLKNGIRSSQGDTVLFTVLFQNKPRRMTEKKFKSICSGGDNGEPVITLMNVDQD